MASRSLQRTARKRELLDMLYHGELWMSQILATLRLKKRIYFVEEDEIESILRGSGDFEYHRGKWRSVARKR